MKMMRAVSLKTVIICLVAIAFQRDSEVEAVNISSVISQGCTSSQPFKCPNGKCIYLTDLCDGTNDCGDGYDEQFCDSFNCHRSAFQCFNGKCFTSRWFCSERKCGDRSEEQFCNVRNPADCPLGWILCPSGTRCIPSKWVCDGKKDCPIGQTEETNCDYPDAKAELQSWLLGRRKPSSRTDRWGSQVHRIAVALHLADESTFVYGHVVGKEIRNELTKKLLTHLLRDKRMSSQELALYIHALLVSCIDPRDFYGNNLVQELRERVEASRNYTNPFLILVLCNAGDAMTEKDVERVTAAHDSQHRPFWTDHQALSSMALSCISSRGCGYVEESVLNDMLQELKKRQFRNGTVDNYSTTALVTQALFTNDSYKTDFDLDSAMKVLTNGLNGSRSLLDVYYTIPLFARKSFLDVTSDHCREPVSGEDSLDIMSYVKRGPLTVQFSIWMGDEITLAGTWRLRMKLNSTIYDAIETVAKIDDKQKVEYTVVDGKPYVKALNGKEDDPEMGMFWFVYLKDPTCDKGPKIVEESPADIKLEKKHEVILWYKRGSWSDHSPVKKTVVQL